MNLLRSFVLIIFLILSIQTFTPTQNLDSQLTKLVSQRSLKGLQIQITQSAEIIYNGNFGKKDDTQPITNETMFRIASLSKSFASAGIMLLVQQNKIRLTQSISSILQFQVKNPNFPDVQITLQMLLTHQSSLIQCEPYYNNFIMDTYNAKKGQEIPNLKQILQSDGKYYNKCLFSQKMPPGTHFQYVNLNFGIAGAIIEKVTSIRFDIFMRDNILKYLSQGLSQTATFNAAYIENPKNLGVIYVGNNGKWSPSYDFYPDGKIPQRNLEGYKVGTNGIIFGPQGGLRASVSHLSNYMIMLANGGVTKNGKRILSQKSVEQMIMPRYIYHGVQFGSQNDFHAYGLGLYTTTYRQNDIVIQHKTLRGHLGSAYGLISGYYFWDKYTLTYQINGALNGYGYGTGTIYERQRLQIHKAIQQFLDNISKYRQQEQ